MKRKIAIISDQRKTLDMYTLLLRSIGNSEIVFKENSFHDFNWRRLRYLNLAIIDLEAEGFSYDTILHLKSNFPKLKVLLVYELIDSKIVLNLLKSGVDGFLERKCFADLIMASNRLLEGGAYLSYYVSRIIVSNFWTDSDRKISQRELEVLKLLAKGKNAREISIDLEISHETSKTHIKNIYTKLNVDKRDRAISKAREERIIL